jgi:hypothetical protein
MRSLSKVNLIEGEPRVAEGGAQRASPACHAAPRPLGKDTVGGTLDDLAQLAGYTPCLD